MRASCFALLGNPNTGKTTLFNQLCGLRARTANFPGSTIEAHVGTHTVAGARSAAISIVDLPGIYSLRLDRPESCTCRDFLERRTRLDRQAEAMIIVADATNLHRNLVFVNQALHEGLPAIVALNMIDLAQRRGLSIDEHKLSAHLGVPVIPVCARSGQGVKHLSQALSSARLSAADLPDPQDQHAASDWADAVVEQSVGGDHAVGAAADSLTDRLDAAFTHPVLGLIVFAAIMTGLFYAIFTLATVPMDLIELLFTHLGQWIGAVIPQGAIHDLLADGVVAGVAGTVVFLPQICLLFFLISLLEDTGYLARAAFVMDRLLRRFGLPGQAFVPMLSAHACAIPAIMSTRLIPDHRDRLATILVAPFLSCSARLPVYVLLIGILFGHNPLLAGIAFIVCYLLGAMAALLTALLFRRTILKGPARPMVLELPTYKMPSIRTALATTIDRASIFLRKAGTMIVAICVALWWLGTYPMSAPPPAAIEMRHAASAIERENPEQAADVQSQADALERRHAKANSFIGRIGRTVEPVFRPIGCDWQVSIGVLSSFLAREVFVSTMAVVLTGDAEDSAEEPAVRDRIAHATRADGSPVFTKASSASLLVFYVLAMQCLPTLAVTRRETGSWKWPLLQLGYMSLLAYVAALFVHTLLTRSPIA